MNLTIGCNWDPALIDATAGIPEVSEFMGSLALKPVGTDRPPMKHPKATPEEVEQYVARVHETGRTFNFLLNAPSLGGREFLPGKRGRVLDYVGWLHDVGVDAVTVASPGLIETIKANFPKMEIHVSHNARVSRTEQILRLAELGADKVCIYRAVNRDVNTLRQMAKASPVPLQVTCLSVCVDGCPLKISAYHLSITISQCTEDGPLGPDARHGHGSSVGWCHLYRLSDPQELLKGCFIRPDDLGLIEDAGISHFKFDTRTTPTPGIAMTARAYAGRRFDGDLKDLLNVFHMADFKMPGAPPPSSAPLDELSKEQIEDAFFKAAMRYDFNELLKFDNRALDGWMNRMLEEPCTASCVECDYCKEYVDKSMTWNEDLRKELYELIKRYRDGVIKR